MAGPPGLVGIEGPEGPKVNICEHFIFFNYIVREPGKVLGMNSNYYSSYFRTRTLVSENNMSNTIVLIHFREPKDLMAKAEQLGYKVK